MRTVLSKNIHLDFNGFELNVFAITSLLTLFSQDIENFPEPAWTFHTSWESLRAPFPGADILSKYAGVDCGHSPSPLPKAYQPGLHKE